MQKRRDANVLPPEQLGCFTSPRTAEELYDVAVDPYQLLNVAADPTYAKVLAQMRRVQEQWGRQTQDEIPATPTPDTFDRETGRRLQ